MVNCTHHEGDNEFTIHIAAAHIPPYCLVVFTTVMPLPQGFPFGQTWWDLASSCRIISFLYYIGTIRYPQTHSTWMHAFAIVTVSSFLGTKFQIPVFKPWKISTIQHVLPLAQYIPWFIFGCIRYTTLFKHNWMKVVQCWIYFKRMTSSCILNRRPPCLTDCCNQPICPSVPVTLLTQLMHISKLMP